MHSIRQKQIIFANKFWNIMFAIKIDGFYILHFIKKLGIMVISMALFQMR